MTDTTRTPLAMGDAFRDAGQVLAQRGPLLLLLSATLVFAGGAAAAWLRFHPPLSGTGFSVGLVNGVVNWLSQAAPQSLFIAAATWVGAETLAGRPPALAETARQGLRLFLPVLLAQVLYLMAVVAGSVLLVVPGIIVALMWMLVTPVLVVERLGIIEAFKRSRVLTKGHRWALLGLIVVYTLTVVGLEWVIFQITAPGRAFVAAAIAPINAYGVVPLITVVTALLSNTVTTAIYTRLSKGHRGSADRTAEVFA
jgi:hypothetical protein